MSADLTMRDLSDEQVRNDARHDLRVAQDFGGSEERAAWVEKWGDAIAALLVGREVLAARFEDASDW